VDTGCTYDVLSGKLLLKVFARAPGFKKYSLLNEGRVIRLSFNGTAYEGNQVPAMAFGMEASES